ncbi:ABC transporter ATP-binding protein [Schaalia vaccimaxillae]|uniref:ABC transporter ATP-binding protein n=1 Tax=Schaalia vaccimaxillae TaxID=183916 RepID=UPI0003B46C33|nr:ABC transporter ATP-binding protein [Schaalia vaccimaxillae]
MSTENADPLLEVDGLVVAFPGRRRNETTTVIHGVSFTLEPGKTLSLVGESGSGKTTIGRAILGLAPVTEGRIRLQGREISSLGRAERRCVAHDIQVVFQDPYTSLNPAMKIGKILAEPLEAAGVGEASMRVKELLDAVGMPADSVTRYAREFSGGQRQRIAIARALALEPKLIICDEPTSALDVTTQARVLELFTQIQKETGVSYLFISHDLGVVNSISDDIAVLYHGRIVEMGAARRVVTAPQHDYTRELLLAAPLADPPRQRERRRARRVLSAREL